MAKKSTERPFFRTLLEELERDVPGRMNDLEFLQLVEHELTFRSTAAARRLASKVSERIAVLQSMATATPTRISASDPPARSAGNLKHKTEAWPKNLFDAWTAIEVLAPQTFTKVENLVDGDHRRVARLDRSALPWENGGERSQPNKRLFYQVLLGTIRMPEATAELLKQYPAVNPEFRSMIGYSPIAVITLTQAGIPVDDEPVAISSFAWAWRIAHEKRLNELAEWPDVESTLCEEVRKRLIRKGEDDEVLPLDRETIFAAHQFLSQRLQLDSVIVEEPRYMLRSYQWFTIADPPEPVLLNSFFIGDLVKARNLIGEGKAGEALQQFASRTERTDRQDLLENPSALEAALSPNAFPRGRWPSPGRHPLVLMQQAAVNLAYKELHASAGLFSINGPPGTGKTTLLRDICASVVVERALRLHEYSDPSTAFSSSGLSLRASGNKTDLFKVDETIRGFEIVVASSNNGAVENITRELPDLDAIATDAQGLRYFQSISDWLVGEEDRTWGLFAAVLGNQRNVSEFKFRAVRDEDRGLLAYLAAAVGVKTVVGGAKHGEGEGTAGPKPPQVVIREAPPSGRRDALKRWEEARTRFKEAIDVTRAAASNLEALRKDCLQRDVLQTEFIEKEAQAKELLAHLQRYQEALRSAGQARLQAAEALARAEEHLEEHRLQRPPWWQRLLRLQAARAWSGENARRMRAVRAAREAKRVSAAALKTHEQSAAQAQSQHLAAIHELEQIGAAHRRLSEHIEHTAENLHAQVLSASSIEESTDEAARTSLHLTSPWFGQLAQRQRDTVFIAALELQRAFVDAAAHPIRQNLAALFGTAKLDSKERVSLLPHLWSTLFLIVPVISTTFASVGRLFRSLPSGSFGWLLIDEAGQATPQAAVGALMRSKRVVVVGDPLQIEPVVSLPEKLIEAICVHFEVEKDRWTAPVASVQTVADVASHYSSTIHHVSGTRQVGLPLIVHRRCQSPMFEISNFVAYGGAMVQGTPMSTAVAALGASRWFDVVGESTAKWSEAEGRVVVELLVRLFESSDDMVDAFVITPFRNVANKLKASLPEAVAQRAVVPRNWWDGRIGTIHTFQGKQASIVLLVLGASSAEERGARNWAAGTPNIVNVAVSRAKHRVYVIGNRKAWEGIGAMKVVCDYLPVDPTFL